MRKRQTVLLRRKKGEETKEEEESVQLSPSILQHAKVPSDVDLSNLPNFEFKSSIISYLEFVRLWQCLPPYVSIRKPEKIFETAEDGYNLLTMYSRCSKFLDEQDLGGADREYYHFSLMLVRTERDFVFGAFISSFPLYSARRQFKGTQESFVFSVRPGPLTVYQAEQEANSYYMLCDYKNLTIGSGGDGPAISLDAELFKGWTSRCETFDSPILVKGGKKHIDDMFQAKNFELFIL